MLSEINKFTRFFGRLIKVFVGHYIENKMYFYKSGSIKIKESFIVEDD